MHHFRYLFSPLFAGSSANIPICILQKGDNELICRKLLQDFQAVLRTYKYNSVSFRKGTMWSFNFTSSSAASFCKISQAALRTCNYNSVSFRRGDNVVHQFHFQTYDQMSSVISTDQSPNRQSNRQAFAAFACDLVIICRVFQQFQQDQCSYGP
jgi:hypothetical protein